MSDSQKPPWIETIPGQPKSFDDPTADEIKEAEDRVRKARAVAIADAQAFVESPATRFATRAQKFLADAERRRVSTEAQLTLAPLFREQGNLEGWRELVIHQVRALRDLGRFQDARDVIGGVASVFDLSTLAADVNETEQACWRDDEWDCGCERETAAIEDSRGQSKPILLNRRVHIRDTFDTTRGKVVSLWRCRHCQQMNAMEGTPERQRNLSLHRKGVETNARIAIAKGQPLPVPLSDASILKA